MRTIDAADRHVARRTKAAKEVGRARVPGHEVGAHRSYDKSFRSRPGSADFKAYCSCGWESSGWHYGATDALASALRHIRAARKAGTS